MGRKSSLGLCRTLDFYKALPQFHASCRTVDPDVFTGPTAMAPVVRPEPSRPEESRGITAVLQILSDRLGL
jgi:hypothetical protein